MDKENVIVLLCLIAAAVVLTLLHADDIEETEKYGQVIAAAGIFLKFLIWTISLFIVHLFGRDIRSSNGDKLKQAVFAFAGSFMTMFFLLLVSLLMGEEPEKAVFLALWTFVIMGPILRGIAKAMPKKTGLANQAGAAD